jgi:hypothetical protein
MEEESARSLLELVVIGVVSGAGGALVTTLLRMAHEREERMRERGSSLHTTSRPALRKP